MIELFQWIMSQLVKANLKNWVVKHSMVVCRGSNTDLTSLLNHLKPLSCYVTVGLRLNDCLLPLN